MASAAPPDAAETRAGRSHRIAARGHPRSAPVARLELLVQRPQLATHGNQRGLTAPLSPTAIRSWQSPAPLPTETAPLPVRPRGDTAARHEQPRVRKRPQESRHRLAMGQAAANSGSRSSSRSPKSCSIDSGPTPWRLRSAGVLGAAGFQFVHPVQTHEDARAGAKARCPWVSPVLAARAAASAARAVPCAWRARSPGHRRWREQPIQKRERRQHDRRQAMQCQRQPHRPHRTSSPTRHHASSTVPATLANPPPNSTDEKRRGALFRAFNHHITLVGVLGEDL